MNSRGAPAAATRTDTPMLDRLHTADALAVVRVDTAADRRHAAEETIGRRLRRLRRLGRR